MVDTTDLKSVDFIGREGSSPSTPSKLKINYIEILESPKVQNLTLYEFYPSFILH